MADNVRPSVFSSGATAALKGLTQMPTLNGKRVKLIKYLPEKGRWRVRILDPEYCGKIYFVTEKCMDLILEHDPIATLNNSQSESSRKVNETVKSIMFYQTLGAR